MVNTTVAVTGSSSGQAPAEFWTVARIGAAFVAVCFLAFGVVQLEVWLGFDPPAPIAGEFYSE
jgi:hypothetical protein